MNIIKLSVRLLAVMCVVAIPCLSRADITLPSFFSNHMVLQREIAAPVWGTAKPGEKITVSIDGQTAFTVAGDLGNWIVRLKPMEAGGPYTLTVSGISTVIITDVLVGDVWLCSGQSNMQFAVGWHPDTYASYIASASDPDLRCFAVATDAEFLPQTDVKGSWAVATPQSVLGFTAVGYFFAREIRQALHVPVGLIHSSYGGTNGESWISLEGISKDPALRQFADNQIEKMHSYAADQAAYSTALTMWQSQHGAFDKANAGFPSGWAAPEFDDRDWTVSGPGHSLASLGLKGGGIVWYRKTVVFPSTPAKDFHLSLGWGYTMFDVYFNGTPLVELNKAVGPFYGFPPQFDVPTSLVKSGQPNTIAIRMTALLDSWGLWIPTAQMGFPVDSTQIDDRWKFTVEQAFPALTDADRQSLPRPPSAAMQNTATTLFNGMIAPLIPYGIKGTLWYQGENNVSRGAQYGTLLPLLINDWRHRWNEGDFPFYIVQLANNNDPAAQPEQSGWALVREGQLHTSEEVPNSGIAVTIDLGEAHNIHPLRKPEVGHRLALIALNRTYGLKQEDSGPIYSGMTIEGDKIRLSFQHVSGGLVCQGGAPLEQFAIAGTDQKFVWADAKIDGNTVVVTSPSISNPVAVRYAWADNPAGCNLYNTAGLPASPFRTDSW